MKTLFISTFNKFIYIALLIDNKIISLEKIKSEQSHSIYTVPTIKKVLEINKLKPKDLEQIEVINGPGSFTGVRIGVTIAKTLAYTLNIPIKTISSLEAYAVSSVSNKNKLVTLSDIKGTYYGLFDKGNKLLCPLNYLSKQEFSKYLKSNHLEEYLIENTELDIEKIHNYLKNIEDVNPHEVKPLYIKIIEALK